MRTVCILLISMLLAWPVGAMAMDKFFYGEAYYSMGERDSAHDGKEISFIRAKRQVVERAGTYVQSETKVSGGKLTQDDVKVYTAAAVRIEILEQHVRPQGETLVAYTKLKGLVDASNLEKDVAAMRENSELKQQVLSQQRENERTQKRIEELSATIEEQDRKIKKAEQMATLNKRQIDQRKQQASQRQIDSLIKDRRFMLQRNIEQDRQMFCTVLCSMARIGNTRFVRTLAEGVGLASMLLGEEQCRGLCFEGVPPFPPRMR